MRITQQQIAERVGVSNVAVSNVLHRAHRSRISDSKQLEILRVAREMGYRPRQVTTHTIGFVVASGEMHLDASENAILFAHEILKARGYRMMFVMVDEANPESLRETLNTKTVDGVLFNCWCGGKIEELIGDDVPWVLLTENEVGEEVDQVSTDTVRVAFNTTRHLLELGHERLCLVTGSAGVGYHERLERGVRQAWTEAGVGAKQLKLIQVVHNAEIGAALMKQMKSSAPPTAVLTASAGKAVTVLNRLQSAGFGVPKDVSLASFGDGYRLTPLVPTISAATLFGRDVIEGAVERLIEKILAPNTPPRHTLLPGDYIERESVAPLRR